MTDRDPGGREWDDDEIRGPEGARAAVPPAVLGLAALSVGFGVIGMATGFATLLGISATAAGGGEVAAYGSMAAVAVTSLVLGVLLVAGGVLLWRAHRLSRVVIGVAVALLSVSALVRMAVDEVDFASVIGSVLSLGAVVVMGALLTADAVREHVRTGLPLRLR